MIESGNHDPRIITRYKTSDQTVNNSVVMVSDNALYFPIKANEVWRVTLDLKINTTAAADWEYQFSVPAGCSYDTAPQMSYVAFPWVTAAYEVTPPADRTNGQVTIIALIRNGATAGTVYLQWTQGTAEATDTKVLIGSLLVATKIK